MITAQEAKKLTIMNRGNDVDRQLAQVEELIKKATSDALNYVYVHDYLKPKVVAVLLDLQYEIYFRQQYNEPYCKISW